MVRRERLREQVRKVRNRQCQWWKCLAKEGDEIVNIQEKLFPDYKANPGDKALVLMHTVPFEGSVG